MSKMCKTWHVDEEMMNRDGSKMTVGTGGKLGRTLRTREEYGKGTNTGCTRFFSCIAGNWPSLKRKRKTTFGLLEMKNCNMQFYNNLIVYHFPHG